MRLAFDQFSLRSNNLRSPEIDDGGPGEEKDRRYADEVMKCSLNAALQGRSTLLMAKTRSRLMDPSEDPEQWSGRVPKSGAIPKSGPMRSWMLSKAGDDDDDETFVDEDLPKDLKMSNFNTLTFLQWLGLILMVVVLIVTLTVPSIKKRYVGKLELWKWEVMVIEHEPYDHKADVFSFGIVLWELLTGKLPYEHLTPLQAAVGVVQKGLRPIIPKNTHPKLMELLERCWQQDPELRPDFSEIITILQQISKEVEYDEDDRRRDKPGGLFSVLRRGH